MTDRRANPNASQAPKVNPLVEAAVIVLMIGLVCSVAWCLVQLIGLWRTAQ